MRRALAPTLIAIAFLGLLVPRAVLAGARQTTHSRAATRTWPLRLAPVPNDLALAEIRFPHAGRRQLTGTWLKVAVRPPFGDDYLVLATPRTGAFDATPEALVLVVNRPSPLLDPEHVGLSLIAHKRLAGHAVTGGLRAAAAVAQAYDVVCGLPYEASFGHLVAGAAPPPAPSPPAPTPTPPVTPPPPSPGPPRCAPCNPSPGYACPEYCSGESALAQPAGRRGD
jgi:hypothetical protein